MFKKGLIYIFLLTGFLQYSNAQNFNMGNLGTINNACGGNFYDSGGPAGNYGNGQLFTATFCAPPGQYLTFNFTSFNTEFLFDWLDIYNGPNTAAPLIGSFTGNNSPGLITSTQGGCITFVFDSDGSQVSSGWTATITCSTTPPSTGNDCGGSLPFCTGISYSFPNNTNQPNLGPIDCLNSTPNPVWYYMQIATPGNLNINIQQTDLFGFGIDVDFDLWGPFSSLADGCADIAAGTAPSIDCSFSPAFIEQANIVGALAGEFYILLLTNFSNDPGTISFNTAAGSTATTNCALLCNITDVTATPTACAPATNNYTVNGQVIVANPPSSGSLIISSSCGGSITLNAPFVSPVNYSLPGIIATGGTCNITASFSADPSCTFTQSYTAPSACAVTVLNCPAYASSSSSPSTACAGQVYYLDVANTACNGTITMNVVGNYGTQYANEITWTVTSNLTGAVLASGGPGTNGAAVNVVVGPLNPAVVGNIFTLTVYDSYGDGFNGSGGFMSVQQNGTTIGGPILPGFWSNSSTIFGANIAISPATITITTPTGPVTSTVTGCSNFHVPLTLQNTNFCNTLAISLPFTITCVSTGAVIASGTKNVTVYPSIPSSASDLVSIVFNPGTCTWSMTPENDCIAANIGNIFTVSPNPATLTPAACTGGGETFTVTYNGISGGPNCCSTGGPLIPIVYNQTFAQSTVVAVSSPFGGINNAALLTIPPNTVGGNATSLNFSVNIAGYCFVAAATSYWVTIIVDGNIVSDVWYNPALVNNTINFNLAGIPNGYNQNSVIQVYIYPNQLSPATFIPNGNCGSLSSGQWTANITGSINATFADMAPTPGVCTFSPYLPFNCCSSNIVADASSTICSGAPFPALTLWQNSVLAANPNCIVYSSVTPVAGTTLPDNILPNGLNVTSAPLQQIVGAYYYCDVDGSATVNSGDTYTLVSTFTLTVHPVPVASISGTTSICSGTSTLISFTGTPNATITYTINGGAGQTISLDAAGNASLNTGNLAANTTYALVSVASSGPPVCSQNVSGSALVTIVPAPVATFTYASPFCSSGANPFPTFTGGGVAGVFSSTAGLVFVSTASGQINLSASTPGTYTITNTIAAAGGCPAVSANYNITINQAPDAGSNGTVAICSNASAINLFNHLGGSPDITGVWTGPSVLTGGHLGFFDPAINTSGVYTYTVNGLAPCPNATATVNVTVDLFPTTSFSYPGAPFCSNHVGSVNPVIVGSTGGSFSSTPAGLTLNSGNGVITPGTSTPGIYTITYVVPASGACPAFSITETVVINQLPSAPSLTPLNPCEGASVTFTAGGGSLYEFFLNGLSQGLPSSTNTIALGPLVAADQICVNSYPPIPFNFNGLISEQEWGSPLATSAGGPPTSGFGAGNNMDAIFLKNGSGYLFGAIAGNLVNNSNNRILLFIDCQAGGFNNLGAWVARSNAPYWSVENLSNSITFDLGFSPEYVLAMNQATANSYFDLYNMVTNSNNYLGDGNTSPWLGFSPNSGVGDFTKGFEFAFPINLLGNPSGSIKVFAMLVNDPGLGNPTNLSNQFLTRANAAELNYGNAAVNFGAAAPNPISYAISADCFAQTCVTVVNSVTPSFNPIAPICSGDPSPLLSNLSLNGITGTWSPAVVNNTASASYTFTPNLGQCASSVTITITVEPTPNLSPLYHD